MKNILSVLILIASMMAFAQDTTIYDFKVKDIKGNTFFFSDLKGKKIMIVNTASKCGFTKQYKNLEKLYRQYKDKGFVIVGFPANNFMKQEPGTNEEIAKFCSSEYGVTFPMMSKISVKGRDQHELYKWLTDKNSNEVENSEVRWNFQKYLINSDGTLDSVIGPDIDPFHKYIIEWIEE